jgi:hypothetical protein
MSSPELYKAINAIMGQLDLIEKRVKALSDQLTIIEKAVAQKSKA